MNTQRPEWNDANNALVGNGVSMVTLCYLRRYLAFCLEVFAPLENDEINVSAEVGQLLQRIDRILQQHRHLLENPLSDLARQRVLDDLGRAGSQYRQAIYARGFSGQRRQLKGATLLNFFKLALNWADHSIQANRRPDRLFHAYNLIALDQPGQIPIRRLYEMLEGQVAVLSSGRLTAEESVDVLRALRRSAIYRADQHSYLLYPNRDLARFVDRNNIPPREIKTSKLLRTLLASGDRSLVEQDIQGRCHFNGSLSNARDLRRALDQLAASGHAKLVRAEADLVLALFERLFDHQSFTGRSGTFFGYEGLGSIYWHMVSKLLLAVQETFFRASESGASPAALRALADSYYDIRSGIGDQKTPDLYGAFPTDPYSHTPAHAGARQPGLTGQVKEDILCRFGELGVVVCQGQISFHPELLGTTDFLREPAEFDYYDIAGNKRRLRLPACSLGFTYCQVPIVYRLTRTTNLVVEQADRTQVNTPELELDLPTSRSIFQRAGMVTRLTVSLNLSTQASSAAADWSCRERSHATP